LGEKSELREKARGKDKGDGQGGNKVSSAKDGQ